MRACPLPLARRDGRRGTLVSALAPRAVRERSPVTADALASTWAVFESGPPVHVPVPVPVPDPRISVDGTADFSDEEGV